MELGTTGTADVTATDPDKGDTVNVTLESSASWLELNRTNLVWSNATDSATPVNVSLEATDSKGLSTTMNVKIQMCGCKVRFLRENLRVRFS